MSSPAPSSFPIGIPVRSGGADRAGQTDFPDARTPRDENHVDPTTRYVTEIDPCVANAIFMKLMELEEEQEAIAQMENDGQKELDEDMALEM